MLTHEIHTRIMLNELREILVDPERPHGGHLPSEMADGLDLDSVTSFLVAADWFEQQGSELENLIRTHCELIDLMPMDWCLDRHYVNHDGMGRHPFLVDSYWSRMLEQNKLDSNVSHRVRLLMSRLESTENLYEGCTRRLGRTTRMLTDVIRRCGLDGGLGPGPFKAATVVCDFALWHQFAELLNKLLRPVIPMETEKLIGQFSLWGKPIRFIAPNGNTECHEHQFYISQRELTDIQLGHGDIADQDMAHLLERRGFQPGLDWRSFLDEENRRVLFRQQREATYTATDHHVIEQRRQQEWPHGEAGAEYDFMSPMLLNRQFWNDLLQDPLAFMQTQNEGQVSDEQQTIAAHVLRNITSTPLHPGPIAPLNPANLIPDDESPDEP